MIIKPILFMPVLGAPPDTKLPERKTEGSAGYDFFATRDFVIMPHERTERIRLNVKIIMPYHYYLKIENRSGLCDKGVFLSCGGIIDADYANNVENDGNIMIRLYNSTNEPVHINKGDRICQGIIHQREITDDDSASGRRIGGFGSTGR